LVLLLASGAGLAAATLYYCQPMLAVVGAELHATDKTVGLVPTFTQLGYALGILLLAPLGDRMDRKRIILAKAAVLTGALLAASVAPSMVWLLGASLLVGLSATLAQDIVPAAATLAPAEARGRVVGKVMTGLLLGILLSRVVSGYVAEHVGWRAMFVAAGGSTTLLAVAMARGLPRFAPTSTLSYGALLGSLWTLWKTEPALRRAATATGLLAVGFGAFWSTLAVMLSRAPFHLGPASVGAFGLAGAAGALAAPLAGRVSDRRGPELVTRLGAGTAALSFASMALARWIPAGAQLPLIVVSAIGFDFGIQASLVAHQTVIYGLDPAARSRLNAVLMVGLFVGMSSGAALGGQALARYGWGGVVALCTLASLAALVVRLSAGRMLPAAASLR